MPISIQRLAAVALCVLPALAHGALIEISDAIGDFDAPRNAVELQLRHAWQVADAAPQSPWLPSGHGGKNSRSAQLLRVASPAAQPATAGGLLPDSRPVEGEITRAGLPVDVDQIPELWTLVVLGAGLVVYQLRRHARSRSGMIRFPH